MLKNQILQMLGRNIQQALTEAEVDFETIQEIRLRNQRPILLIHNNEEIFLKKVVTQNDLKEILELACEYSAYAFEEEIRRGYITVSGGHRIGITGRCVLSAGEIKTLKNISSLNIRIAHQIKGCAEKYRGFFYEGGNPCHVLIISPPGCGKTTLLRDIVRILSNGVEKIPGVTVGVVDERSEIAGSFRGIPTHDLGIRTDVLDGCPKNLGMEMMLRSMSPKVLAVDEIGAMDVDSIELALRCGCKVLATLHGETMQDFLEKPGFQILVKEKVFERYIILENRKKVGRIRQIYGQEYELFWEESACI